MADPQENHLTTRKQNLFCRTCDPSEARTHSSDITSDLDGMANSVGLDSFSHHMSHVIRKPVYAIYANNKGPDQPAHPHSLINTFVVRCLNSIIPTLLAKPKLSIL